MGRKINYEIKNQIEKEARRLFLEKGYKATSMNDIAKVIGKEKTYVQKHFPKKEIFIYNFFSDLLDASDLFFAERNIKTKDYYMNLYLIGQIHFAFLLSTKEMKKFTIDILSDRELTEVLIKQDMEWASEYLTHFPLEEEREFKDNVTIVMGGIYELAYQHIKSGRPLDPQKLQKKAMMLFTFVQGLPIEETDKRFEENVISDALFADAITFLRKSLFLKCKAYT
ncbi:MAG: helix-turn-helix domain-containing protein [Bacillota bacterium]|nr:helix-turn-helix domain-containing protein [Bacillota bacterium]